MPYLPQSVRVAPNGSSHVRSRALGSFVLRTIALLTLALLLLNGVQPGALAAGVYAPGTTGSELTWFGCLSPFPDPPQTFAIISISGGRAFYANPCLISEFAWARNASTPPSFLLNLNSPVGTTAFEGRSGPKGSCRSEDALCLSYNFGYNAARLAAAYAQSQETSAPMWWLDVETENTWSDNAAANGQVIQGAIDSLAALGFSAGIYSTPLQWNQIAGNFSPALPVWLAGAQDANSAPGYCTQSQSFGGGPVWLVQYTNGDHNNDYACAI